MTSRLDFGPDMLALFLRAHVMRAGLLAATKSFEQRADDTSRIRAEREYILDLAAASDLRAPTVRRAIRADKRLSGEQRAALWLAMGINPMIHEREPA